MRNNRAIIKDAIKTGDLTSGLLNPGQARKFIQQTFEATPLSGMIRHEIRTEKSGEIDKIGIGKRLLRKKIEDTDDGYRAKPNYGKLTYSTTAVRLPWEITEETLRENIEGQSFESIVTGLMTKQIGVDNEDLGWNGDEAVLASDPDYDFLKINTGWLKQIKNGGHVYDITSVNSGSVLIDTFYTAMQKIPNKFNDGSLRWMMSPLRAQMWEKYLLNQIITAGGAVPDSVYNSPAGIKTVVCPSLPNDVIVLTDPKNLIEVSTYSVRIRKTNEGKEAIMQDKRFYVVHYDVDFIIEELDATAVITGIA